MSAAPKELSQTLDAQRLALAEAVVARQYRLRPELRDRYGVTGQARCVQDTAYHLAYLASALSASSPALFRDYISWARVVLATHRIRSEDVAENLVCLREVLGERLPADLAALVRPYLDQALEQFPTPPPNLPSFLQGNTPLTRLARAYLEALLAHDRGLASRLILDALRAGTSLGEIYLGVFQPCQREIGRLWQTGKLSVGEEHYCTAATQLIMSQLFPYLFAAPRNGYRLVAACAAGDLHEMGLRIVCDLFESDGWDTVYLGANVPSASIVQSVREHGADLVLLSATMSYHLPALEEVIRAVRLERDDKVKVLVGGYPFRVDPDLWWRVGADSSASDAAEALRTAHRLLAGKRPLKETAGPFARAELPPAEPPGEPPVNSDPGYQELTGLNNELVALQRELARKNAQLEGASRLKDEFLAILGHELRNLLAPLRNALQVTRLRGDEPSVRQWSEALQERQVRHMTRLVDDLLDVSRISQGKVQLHPEQLDLAQLVRTTAEDQRGGLEAAGLRLQLELPSEPVWVRGDPTRLAQGVGNLLGNAGKFTDSGGTVSVRLRADRDSGRATVTVQDTGIGIDAEMLARVFDTFAQVEGSRHRSRGGLGLGLGLALVKGLVELHGGEVRAASNGPGQGSEFAFWLPLDMEPAARPETSPPSTGPEAPSQRILIIEDNEDAAATLRMLLEAYGHQAETAHTGQAGVGKARQFRPDVVLCDIGLPGMDGFAVARALRSDPALARAKLVALSGYGSEADQQQGREAGFDLHLIKPVDFEELQRVLLELPVRAGE